MGTIVGFFKKISLQGVEMTKKNDEFNHNF